MDNDIDKLLEQLISEIKDESKLSKDEFRNKVNEKLPEIVKELFKIYPSSLIQYYDDKLIGKIHEDEQNYRDLIQKYYSEGFKYLEIFLDLNKYCGQRILEIIEQNDSKDLKQNILFRLHSKCCQVFSEIKILLKNGYPDGAQARWRTLHELAVTFMVIQQNNDETCRMYVDFEVIEKYKRAQDFESKRNMINWKPIPNNQMKVIKEKRNELIDKYGKEFKDSYGWTKNILPKGRRNFRELEELVKMDFMRPFYSWSNDNIHSGISGIKNRLGHFEKLPNTYLRFTGPSVYGLADPVQFAVSTLKLITQDLVDDHKSLKQILTLNLLDILDEKIKDEFFKSQLKLKED